MAQVQSAHECYLHKKQHAVQIPNEHLHNYYAWQREEDHIQVLLPTLSANEREILMTGTCQEAWDKSFPDEDCPDDCDGSSHPGLFCR